MTGPVFASGRDLRALAGIVSADRGEPPAQGMAPSLLTDLLALVRCDHLVFQGVDGSRQRNWFTQFMPAEASDGWYYAAAFWEHYWSSLHDSYRDRSGDLRSVIKVSDFYSARQWRNTGMYRDCCRPDGVEHKLSLCLPAGPGPIAGPGRTLRLAFLRGPGPDFCERDRDLLTVLRPHLHQAYLDAERRRHPAPQLTDRHWDLLHLLAAGHTNAQIARRLGISEGTVRTHLEHIYRLLGVSSRAAAVTRAFTGPSGLTPPDPRPGPTPARPRIHRTGLSPPPATAGLSLHSRS
jgi:DNA-binding CsgD family transcriptional regulator